MNGTKTKELPTSPSTALILQMPDAFWSLAIEATDDRSNYGEERWVALGLIGSRLHVLTYTVRDENMRLISLRKANRREREYYEEET